MKNVSRVVVAILFVVLVLLFFGWRLFGPAGTSGEIEVFTVPQDAAGLNFAATLKEKGFIRSPGAFQFLMDNFAKGAEIKPGGYRLNKKMNAWQVLKKVTSAPDLLWVSFTGCPRKEQIGEKLAAVLGWSSAKLTAWNTVATTSNPDYFEGVYYPDTYLLPVSESVGEIAQRLISRFNEKFAPLSRQFTAANIKWTTGLKIASLIAREAAGGVDTKIISGIIWNRLNIGMPLQIDATMQYTLGKRPDGSWWGSIDLAEKQNDSPYNSYLYKGLPPTPICSPNITMIEAALNPAETACLFYLHDRTGQIHCAETYAEHLANIRKYLN